MSTQSEIRSGPQSGNPGAGAGCCGLALRNRLERWCLPLTDSALCAWTGPAAPSDRIAYHRGFLAWDLAPEMRTVPRAQQAEPARVASRARYLADDGAVHLFQRREEAGEFTYLPIVRPRPRQQGIGALLQLSLASTEAIAPRTAVRPITVRPVSYQVTVLGVIDNTEAGHAKVKTDLADLRLPTVIALTARK